MQSRSILGSVAFIVLLACAGEDTGSGGSAGSGGVGGGTGGGPASTTTVATSVSSVSTGGACAQDCSTIPTPPCYVATCNTDTGTCDLGIAEDGTSCEDGLYCTVDDTCDGGMCESGEAMRCPGSMDTCLQVTCDETQDACIGTPVPNGSPCTSADICMENAICQNGTCLGAPKDCSATPVPNECNVAVCDPLQNGACVVMPTLDGFPCINGDPCESDKTCDMGSCVGTPIVGCSLCPEVEPNNSIAEANDDQTCTGWQGVIGVIADGDYFAVDVTVAGSRIRAQTTDLNGTGCPGFDSVIRLYNSAGTEIAQNDQSPVNSPCSLIDVNTPGAMNLPIGTYYVRVEDWLNNGTSPPYLLLLNVYPPGCGDAILQAGEQCDDGNLTAGDDCDASCMLEPPICPETEPNGTTATAESDPTCPIWGGGINASGDQDYYQVDVTVAGSRIEATVNGLNGAACVTSPSFDSVVRLYNSGGTEIAMNDNGPANSPCSSMGVNTPGATNLAVGTYYVRVEENGNNATSNTYLLSLGVYPPGCGDGILQTGEQCDDNNTIDGDGCSSTCALFTCGPTEVLIDVPASAGLPAAITDNMTTTSNLTVAQTGVVTKIAVVMNITHTYTGDLDISLDAPGATPTILVNDVGGSGDNFVSTAFSSDSTTPITSSAAPFTGVFAPQGGFASILGTAANGTWTLTVFDDAGGDIGTLNSWKVVACVQP